MIALQQEHNIVTKQVATLFEEKAMVAIDMQSKIEKERMSADLAARE